MAYVELDITLYMTFQKLTEFPVDFLAISKDTIETIKAHNGKSGYHSKLIKAHPTKICEEDSITLKEATDDVKLSAMMSLCNGYNACMFICISDNGRYRSLKTTLDNEHFKKKDSYTKTLHIAL